MIVVGGGIAGLTAAAELAAHKCSVALYERADHIGGKIRSEVIDGRPIDVGPTVLTMRWVFDQVFRDLGRRLEEAVALKPAQSVARHAWDDGASLELFFEEERSREAIRELSGTRDADGYLAFCRYARRIYENAYSTFMLSPDPSIRGMARTAGPRAMGTVFRIDPFRKMVRALRRFFRDPRLVQLFARYATYYGSSPFAAPATLNLIAHVEQQGVWLPLGGMTELASALAKAATELGAQINRGNGVQEIRTENGEVTGAVLDDGELVTADAVVYNGDVAALSAGLLGETVRAAARSMKPRDRSLSALVVAMLGRTSGVDLSSHNVFFHTGDYAEEFDDIFSKGRLPANPTVYIRAQDRDQPGLESAAKERLFWIINAPPRGDVSPPTATEKEKCIHQATELLQRAGLNISFDANEMRMISPAELSRRFPGTGGAIYGPATHSMWASLRRMGARSKISGLYLAGGSVHPGAGVPMAALGGRQAASALLADASMTGPFPLTATRGGMLTG